MFKTEKEKREMWRNFPFKDKLKKCWDCQQYRQVKITRGEPSIGHCYNCFMGYDWFDRND